MTRRDRPLSERDASADASAGFLACAGRCWRLSWENVPEDAAQELAAVLAVRTEADLADARIGPADAPPLTLGVAPDGALPPPGAQRLPDGAHRIALPGAAVTLGADPAGAASAYGRDAEGVRIGVGVWARMTGMRLALADGGAPLHAASVRIGSQADGEDGEAGDCFVFAGPSGAGKTTAAAAFGPGALADEDLVLLAPDRAGVWRRLPWWPWRGAAGPAVDAPRKAPPRADERPAVRAVLLPERGEGMRIIRLDAVEAVRRCLHLPTLLRDAETTRAALDHLAALAQRVPICRLAWRPGEPLADELPRRLARPDG